MVARNFSLQDLTYTRLSAVSDGDDEERPNSEFLTLQELKPHHLTEITQFIDPSISTESLQHSSYSNNLDDGIHDQGFSVYYDLSNHQPHHATNNNSQCVSDIFEDERRLKNNEMTAGSSFNNSHHSVESQNTNNNNNNNNNVQMSSQTEQQQQQQHNKGSSRKRKFSYSEVSASDVDDDAKSVRTTDENKKANHSEIEKRRRDKMNNFISELSSMIPMCHAMSRKLDKLTVLRMAVQHLKTIRGAVHSYTEGMHKPAFLSDQELKMLILQAAEGFLFVVGCDRGRILYVSESVSDVLNYSQGDLLGQSWFDILHPKDVAKIKEQLSSSDLSPRERLIDAKTMLPVKHSDLPQGATKLCPGTRRSFFCRMKCKSSLQVKEENEQNLTNRKNKKQHTDKRFCLVQCTGYLKSWAPTKNAVDEQESEAEGECNLSLSCLVAVGRLVDLNKNPFMQNLPNENKSGEKNDATSNPKSPMNCKLSNENFLRNFQFTSRHAMDGKYLFVDQRATLVLGFLPQELLGTSMYEYFKPKDITALAEAHKEALQSNHLVTTHIYGLRTKHNSFIPVKSEWKSFRNPWTKDVEFLIAKNFVIFSDIQKGFDDQELSENNYDFFNQSANGNEMHRLINTHIEASKIGSQIAEQVLDYQRRMGESSDSSPDPDPFGNIVPENMLNASFDMSETSGLSTATRVNGTYSNTSNYQNRSDSSMGNDNEHASSSESSEQAVPESNDDAAMAVIMSLLEADAGLGGPVDFSSGLPWPLP